MFDADYVREHLTHGYATTVHSAQGVTADATHALLGENTSRSMLYVAMTRARDVNTAYFYERTIEVEYGAAPADGPHVLQRGTRQQAGQLARIILEAHDDVPVTAHQVAATTPRHLLPDRVAGLLDRRSTERGDRGTDYTQWLDAVDKISATVEQPHQNEYTWAASRGGHQSRDSGIEI